MNEKILVEQLKKGSTKALEKLIDAYSGYVRTVIRNFSGGALNSEDVDEVTWDVFYKLWHYRENIDAAIGVRAYLSVTAKNTVKNHYRKLKQDNDDIYEIEIPSDFLVEDVAEINEMMGLLYEGLRMLKEDEQNIFFRYYFYGEKSSQIANLLGLTEGTVHTKLHRTRTKLKDFLGERGYSHA